MSQLIKGNELLALSQLKDFWGLEFEYNVNFLARINILEDKFLSFTEDRAIHENQAGVLGPRMLPIVH